MEIEFRSRPCEKHKSSVGGQMICSNRWRAGLVALAIQTITPLVPAAAASVTAQINDDAGHPLPFAVLTLTGAGGSTPKMAPASNLSAKIIDQRDETFVPYVVAIVAGGAVTFRNSDTTRHHVYTFAPIHPFEFILKPGDISVAQVFDKPGVAAIGCNIHDHMIAYVYVSKTPLTAISDHDGRAIIDAVPPGSYSVDIWYPQLKPGMTVPSGTVVVGSVPASITASIPAVPHVDDMMDDMN